MKDEEEDRAIKVRDKEEDNTKKTKGKKDKQPQQLKIEPWGIYQRATPDQNNMFNITDLPKETYEPPATPKGRLR